MNCELLLACLVGFATLKRTDKQDRQRNATKNIDVPVLNNRTCAWSTGAYYDGPASKQRLVSSLLQLLLPLRGRPCRHEEASSWGGAKVLPAAGVDSEKKRGGRVNERASRERGARINWAGNTQTHQNTKRGEALVDDVNRHGQETALRAGQGGRAAGV